MGLFDRKGKGKVVKVFQFPMQDELCAVRYGALEECERESFLHDISSALIKKFHLVGCNLTTETKSGSRSYPYFHLPQIIAAFTKNTTIEELELGEEFLERIQYRIRLYGERECRTETYHAELSKLSTMTSLKTLTLSVSEDADFSKLGEYLNSAGCTLKCLKIKTKLTEVQLAKLAGILVDVHHIQYEGDGQEAIQAMIDAEVERLDNSWIIR